MWTALWTACIVVIHALALLAAAAGILWALAFCRYTDEAIRTGGWLQPVLVVGNMFMNSRAAAAAGKPLITKAQRKSGIGGKPVCEGSAGCCPDKDAYCTRPSPWRRLFWPG